MKALLTCFLWLTAMIFSVPWLRELKDWQVVGFVLVSFVIAASLMRWFLKQEDAQLTLKQDDLNAANVKAFLAKNGMDTDALAVYNLVQEGLLTERQAAQRLNILRFKAMGLEVVRGGKEKDNV
jgi:hypothetical protein